MAASRSALLGQQAGVQERVQPVQGQMQGMQDQVSRLVVGVRRAMAEEQAGLVEAGHGEAQPVALAEVEDDVDVTGDDVAGAGAAVHVGNLPGGRRKEVVAAIPLGGGEFGDGRGGEVDRVFAQLRISDMRLDALDAQPAMQRTASAVLHGVAEDLGAGRLADNAVIQGFAACRETLDDLDRAVGRRTFLVGGDQPGDRAGCSGCSAMKPSTAARKCGDGALHVGRAATVEPAIAFGRGEWDRWSIVPGGRWAPRRCARRNRRRGAECRPGAPRGW
jgi:hypothetical protein